MSDLLVILKNTPLSEEDGPIALIGVDQREAKRASIGHIGSDVQEILEEPEERKDEPVGLAMEEEKSHTKQRDDEFTQSATKDHDGMPERTKAGMTGLVDGEVGIVEEEEARIVPPGVEQEEEIEGQYGSSTNARDPRPLIGAIEWQFHKISVTGAAPAESQCTAAVAPGETSTKNITKG